MSLRISGPDTFAASRGLGAGNTSDAGGDSYLERLVKLVPTEVIGAYPMLKASAAPNIAHWALPLATWILLAVVIVLRWQATYSPDRGPQWTAIALAAVSFVIRSM